MRQKVKVKNKSLPGFTLIELLVVISVISFLASILLVYVNDARVSSRNITRIDNVNQLAKAFNLGNGIGSGLNNNGLPDTTAATLTDGTNSGGLVCVSDACTGGLSSYQGYAPVRSFLSP